MHKSFSPAEEKVKWATELLKEYEIQKAKNVGVFIFKGQMIDMPTIIQAQNVVNTQNSINNKTVIAKYLY